MARQEEEKEDVTSRRIAALPLNEELGCRRLRNYGGFWYPESMMPGIMAAQEHFKPRETDVILCCQPKCGTTWLKALCFSVLNRRQHHPSSPDHPLLHRQPHELVRFIEFEEISKLEEDINMDTPRLLSSHLPYSHLPANLSGCRIVYICREPKDKFVSAWHYWKILAQQGQGKSMEPAPFDKALEMYCKGIFPFGPVWDHMLEYYEESRKRPSQVLFLTYENLLEDTAANLRRVASFLGCAFSGEEGGLVVEEIVRLCSFDHLSGLELSKTGQHNPFGLPGVTGGHLSMVKNSSSFRKGKVGDWKNHLTDEMARRVDEITEEKLRGTGLPFGKTKTTL